MKKVLDRITELYVDLVPKALANCKIENQLYAAFILYDMNEMSLEDQPKFCMGINLLDTAYLQSIMVKYGDDSDEASRMAYLWGECINGSREIMIDSSELHDLLLGWFEWFHGLRDSIESDDDTMPRDEIGGAIAAACLTLNNRGWQGRRFTSDFVLFTDCPEDTSEDNIPGIPQSVPESWLIAKKDAGMLLWL